MHVFASRTHLSLHCIAFCAVYTLSFTDHALLPRCVRYISFYPGSRSLYSLRCTLRLDRSSRILFSRFAVHISFTHSFFGISLDRGCLTHCGFAASFITWFCLHLDRTVAPRLLHCLSACGLLAPLVLTLTSRFTWICCAPPWLRFMVCGSFAWFSHLTHAHLHSLPRSLCGLLTHTHATHWIGSHSFTWIVWFVFVSLLDLRFHRIFVLGCVSGSRTRMVLHSLGFITRHWIGLDPHWILGSDRLLRSSFTHSHSSVCLTSFALSGPRSSHCVLSRAVYTSSLHLSCWSRSCSFFFVFVFCTLSVFHLVITLWIIVFSLSLDHRGSLLPHRISVCDSFIVHHGSDLDRFLCIHITRLHLRFQFTPPGSPLLSPHVHTARLHVCTHLGYSRSLRLLAVRGFLLPGCVLHSDLSFTGSHRSSLTRSGSRVPGCGWIVLRLLDRRLHARFSARISFIVLASLPRLAFWIALHSFCALSLDRSCALWISCAVTRIFRSGSLVVLCVSLDGSRFTGHAVCLTSRHSHGSFSHLSARGSRSRTPGRFAPGSRFLSRTFAARFVCLTHYSGSLRGHFALGHISTGSHVHRTFSFVCLDRSVWIHVFTAAFTAFTLDHFAFCTRRASRCASAFSLLHPHAHAHRTHTWILSSHSLVLHSPGSVHVRTFTAHLDLMDLTSFSLRTGSFSVFTVLTRSWISASFTHVPGSLFIFMVHAFTFGSAHCVAHAHAFASFGSLHGHVFTGLRIAHTAPFSFFAPRLRTHTSHSLHFTLTGSHCSSLLRIARIFFAVLSWISLTGSLICTPGLVHAVLVCAPGSSRSSPAL